MLPHSSEDEHMGGRGILAVFVDGVSQCTGTWMSPTGFFFSPFL